MRFAILGNGRIAKYHIEAIDAVEGLSVVAICDKSLKTSDKAGSHETTPDKAGQPCYFKSLDEMLAWGEFDIVAICTPSGVHYENTIDCLKKGFHVVTEKPMAMSTQECEDMILTAKNNDRELFVLHQNRLNPTCKALKEAVDMGRFGKLYMLVSNVFWYRPQSYYNLAEWRGTWEMDGGVFMNQAMHYSDMLNWIVDSEIEHVDSNLSRFARDIKAEDAGVASIRWECGTIGSLNVTSLTYGGNQEGSITVIGEHGFAKIAGVALNKIDKWCFKDRQEIDENIHELSYEIDSVYGSGHVKYYEQLKNYFDGNKDAMVVKGKDAIRAVKLVYELYQDHFNKQA